MEDTQRVEEMELIALDYSPWSRKARWALDHHRLRYDYVEYLPMVGALYLRAKARRPFGLVTVPLLIQDELPQEPRLLRDSFDIARFADGVGREDSLAVEASRGWNEASERMMSAGRALAAVAVLEEPRAQQEILPGQFPDPLRPVLRPVARLGARYLGRKYGFAPSERIEHRRTLHRGLMELRRALEGRDHLLERFSYADVAMAIALQFVQPVQGWIPLAPVSRQCWTQEELAEEFDDLLAWRDELFARHAPWARNGL